jgi:type IV pilus assembly protein PilZ
VARYVQRVAPPQGAERRTAPRLELELEVSLESDNNFYTGLTQDISTGGLFVATHHLRAVGQHVTVRLTLPEAKEQIVVESEVRWLRQTHSPGANHLPDGMGLKFLGLSAPAKTAIGQFLDKRESLFYDDE